MELSISPLENCQLYEKRILTMNTKNIEINTYKKEKEKKKKYKCKLCGSKID